MDLVQKYNMLLARAREERPGHPLLEWIGEMYSPIKIRHLEKILFEEEYVSNVDVEAEHIGLGDEEKKAMYRELRHLLSKRAKLSNSFHACRTDEERKDVSKYIVNIENVIMDIRERLDSNTPAVEEEEDVMSAVQAIKKRNSLRAQVSRYKKKLRYLSSLPEGHSDKSNIPVFEDRLKKNRIKIERLDKIIKESEAV